jgi:hypothetical protein
MRLFRSAFAGLSVLVALGAGSAVAAPDISGSTTFIEPSFGAYTAIKQFEVYAPDNPTNPLPLAGNYTYLYTITNTAGSFTCLIGFDEQVPAGSVTAAGFIPGAGVDPSGTTIGAVSVEWDWITPTLCPGQTSDQLYVHSTWGPGGTTDTMVAVSDEFSLDTTGTCVGPTVPPEVVGDPMPCTIGFWKNRADGKQGTLQWFPNGDFDAVVDAAVALSMGTFVDAADLLDDLTSKGRRTILERGRQQLAATLLNLAAGDLFPDNQKCKLFEGNHITTNDCGDDLSVGTAVNNSIVGLGGDECTQHDAHECLDDINNGISVD